MFVFYINSHTVQKMEFLEREKNFLRKIEQKLFWESLCLFPALKMSWLWHEANVILCTFPFKPAHHGPYCEIQRHWASLPVLAHAYSKKYEWEGVGKDHRQRSRIPSKELKKLSGLTISHINFLSVSIGTVPWAHVVQFNPACLTGINFWFQANLESRNGNKRGFLFSK